jgi:hypothetical protein
MNATIGSRRTCLWVALALATLGSVPAAAGGKKYFMTLGTFTGAAALEACGKGYHMASLWEIFEISQLKYDAKRGHTREDSGSGPPGELLAWIRTGGASTAINTPGVGNCSAWTSDAKADRGTIVELNGAWGNPAAASSPWNAATATCDTPLRVWCKQN